MPPARICNQRLSFRTEAGDVNPSLVRYMDRWRDLKSESHSAVWIADLL